MVYWTRGSDDFARWVSRRASVGPAKYCRDRRDDIYQLLNFSISEDWLQGRHSNSYTRNCNWQVPKEQHLDSVLLGHCPKPGTGNSNQDCHPYLYSALTNRLCFIEMFSNSVWMLRLLRADRLGVLQLQWLSGHHQGDWNWCPGSCTSIPYPELLLQVRTLWISRTVAVGQVTHQIRQLNGIKYVRRTRR